MSGGMEEPGAGKKEGGKKSPVGIRSKCSFGLQEDNSSKMGEESNSQFQGKNLRI